MLKKDGLFFFTCASTGRPEHGTRRTSPQDSYGTIGKLEDNSELNVETTSISLMLLTSQILTSYPKFSSAKIYVLLF